MNGADAIDIVPGPSRFFEDAPLLASPETQAAQMSEASNIPTAEERLGWARRVAVFEAALSKEYAGSAPGRCRTGHAPIIRSPWAAARSI